ncbi:hypothetical protein BXT84_10365 [Sulfobacillus thermotolerans]|uniref:FAD-binding PCMH-type domain-containing protein n=1 Tax=Sulfobacillus thermotolerans TaxID=338644 RepID=A0ABN5H0N1_9FIRM|nr:hypothetical protein BXT84_10365 [Sulfobacillus thermotolerans]
MTFKDSVIPPTDLSTLFCRILPAARIIADRARLTPYQYDGSARGPLPSLVLLPQTRAEFHACMMQCISHAIPFIIRGSGTNLCGATVIVKTGVIISTALLRDVEPFSKEDLVLSAEPGVLTKSLEAVLQPLGLFYAPDPGSYHVSTLGGNFAQNAGGIHSIRYGVTTHHVLCAHVLMADGSTLDTPPTADYRSVLDITGLLVGSEGTLAIAESITVSLLPQAPAAATFLAAFESITQATASATALIARDVPVVALELMDRPSMDIVMAYTHAQYPPDAAAILLIEIEGHDSELAELAQGLSVLLTEHGANLIKIATDRASCQTLWEGRRAQYGAAARLAPRVWVQDIVVPRPELGKMMEHVLRISERYNVKIFTVAHAGDGNLHPDIAYDPKDAEEVSRVQEAVSHLLTRAVALGGSISGEHGIGKEKLAYMPLMFTTHERRLMEEIKNALDPQNVLNPGKAISTERTTQFTEPKRVMDLARRDIQTRILDSQEPGSCLITGHNLRLQQMGYKTPSRAITTRHLNHVLDIDQDNFTITVDAGIEACEIAERLAAYGMVIDGLSLHTHDTIGGLIAANTRHWRHGYGREWRDVVLQMQWIDGRGRLMQFGSHTMKNVAGYDVAKLMIGSWGKLGVITQMTLRARRGNSPVYMGTIDNLSPLVLLDMALAISTAYDRPHSLILRRWNKNVELVLVALTVHQVEYAQWQAFQYGTQVSWEPVADYEDTIDQERLLLAEHAAKHGAFYEGGLLRSRLKDLLLQIRDSDSFTVLMDLSKSDHR